MENWKTCKDCRLHLWKVLLWQQWSELTLSSSSAIKLGACVRRMLQAAKQGGIEKWEMGTELQRGSGTQ